MGIYPILRPREGLLYTKFARTGPIGHHICVLLKWQREGLGAFVDSGKVLLRFEAVIPAEDADDPAAAKLLFYNRVGAVLQDLKSLGGGDTDYLSLHRIARYHPAARNALEAEDAQGDVYKVSYALWWGV